MVAVNRPPSRPQPARRPALNSPLAAATTLALLVTLLLLCAPPAAAAWNQSLSCDTSQLEGYYPPVVTHNMCRGVPQAAVLLPAVLRCLYTPLPSLQVRRPPRPHMGP